MTATVLAYKFAFALIFILKPSSIPIRALFRALPLAASAKYSTQPTFKMAPTSVPPTTNPQSSKMHSKVVRAYPASPRASRAEIRAI